MSKILDYRAGVSLSGYCGMLWNGGDVSSELLVLVQ